jgi:integrase
MGVELREKILPSGKISLVLDTYEPGRRKTKQNSGKKGIQKIRATGYILTGDKKLDKEKYLKAEMMLAKARLEFDSRNGDASPADFKHESFISYMRRLAENKEKANTRRGWEQALKHFEEFVEGRDVAFGELTSVLFERFRTYLLSEVSSPNSANSYLMRLKAAVALAVRDGRIGSNPIRYVSIKTSRKLPTYLNIEEVQKLASTPLRDVNVRNAFLFGVFTGLRISDIQALQWEQIVDGHVTFSQVKTGKAESMPLSEQAKTILDEQRRLNPTGQVFILPSTPAIDSQLRTWSKRAGVKPFSFHVSRHTFAVLALEQTTDIWLVSKLLGHSDVRTTQRYATVTDKRKQDAVAKLPRIALPSIVERSA